MPTPRSQQTDPSKAAADEPRLTRAASYFGSRTDVGHVREHNEDSLTVVPPLFAVADGMGGHEAGEVASEIAINTLNELAPDHADADALARAVAAANLEVIKAPAKGIGREGMGTTLTAAILEGERLLIAQVGDSRAYLLHQGKLQQLTRDHSLMADMIEAGQLTEEEARVHPNRSVITRAIGSDPHMQPDIYELNVEAGDRILLCSDGICTMLEDRAIEPIMARSGNAQKCADALVDAALEAGGYDNATAVVMDVEGFRKVRERKAERKSKRWFVAIIAAVVIALCAAVAAGFYYVNQSGYLSDESGHVAVHRGIDEELFGMPLSSLDRTTDIALDQLQPGVASRIREGAVTGSYDEMNALIDEYRAQISQSAAVPGADAAQGASASSAQPSGTQGGE